MRQLAVHVNTTGLEPERGHRIVEVAAVEVVDNELTGNAFHRYLNPDRTLDADASRALALSAEFLSSQPRIHQIAGAFSEYVRGAQLLIHNAHFDLAFIDEELLRVNAAPLRAICSGVVDTLMLAKRLYPGGRKHLYALRERYGIDRAKISHSGSLLDATLLAELYLAGLASLRVDLPEPAEHIAIWTPDMELELFTHLRKNPEGLFDLSPRRFEELIAAIFRNNGFTVELTPQPEMEALISSRYSIRHSRAI